MAERSKRTGRKRVAVAFRLDPELLLDTDLRATGEGLSRTAYVERALHEANTRRAAPARPDRICPHPVTANAFIDNRPICSPALGGCGAELEGWTGS